MTRFSSAEIRNVALVGHGGAGKTTLAEALLHRAGAIDRLGRVDDGTTVCDHEPEEQRRHLSLSLAVAPFEWKGHKVNLIDTPGYADFIGEVRAALRVVDLAVFVVSAVDGVEVQTEAIWREAERLGLPRMIFVNKLDRERASFTRTLDQLRDRFGAGIAPLELPIGEEAAFHGVADLLTDTAYLYADGQVTTGPIPEEMAALEHRVHDNLVEGIVVADDALLEGYLDGQVPPFEQLEHTLARGVDEASVFPVVCGSATSEVAIDRLADFICEIGPSPVDRPSVTVTAGDVEVEVAPDETADPLVTVFKTIADPYVGRITLFKVLSGTLHVDDHLVNPRSGADERLHGLALMRGKEQQPAPEIPAGDLGAVAKLTDTVTGDTLAPKGRPVVLARPDEPPPAYSVAVVPHTQADDDKLATALHRITDEDPSIHVSRNDETHQTLVSGAGDTHVAVTLERLERRFGVHVDTEEVRVAYRETITGTAEAEGKYKKQTGGHGQFGLAEIRVAPLDRGAGFEFVDKIVGGAIPRQFIPAVQKGVEEAMSHGGVFGYPVVDVQVSCLDGKYHSVDSSEMSFKMAGRLGFQAAIAKASPVLLEPISQVTVTVPSELQGDVLGDLNARRGRVQGTEAAGAGEHDIHALVPTAELRRYAIDLRSLTGGRGRFTVEPAHYDQLPAHLVDQVKRDVHEPE